MNKLAFILTMVGSIAAWAGPLSSGGGHAVVCTASDGSRSVELLDLYEAREKDGYELRTPLGDVLQELIRAASRSYRLQGISLPPHEDIEAVSRHNHKFIFDRVTFHWSEEGLPLTYDWGEPLDFLKENCELKQLAIFYDTNRVLEIDGHLFSELDSLNKAALVSHESTYWIHRQFDDIDSAFTRRQVAILYSKGEFTSASTGIPKSAATCRFSGPSHDNPAAPYPTNTWFRAFQMPGNPEKQVIQFYSLLGRHFTTQTRIIVPTKGAKPNESYAILGHEMQSWTARFIHNNGATLMKVFRPNGDVAGEFLMKPENCGK